ncbi:MAG: hypothetical protein ACK4S4_01780 [Pyrinomonadaceae bacterium]
MSLEKLSISRRHVLGDLHGRCDQIDLVPVFLDTEPDVEVGFADQSLGRYADAFSFHLPADICKKLSSGQFAFSIGYATALPDGSHRGRPRIRLTYICLTKIRPIA